MSVSRCRRSFRTSGVAAVVILASTGGRAEPQMSSTQIEPSLTSRLTPWRIYGGISTGLGKVSRQDYQSAPGGALVGLSLLASYEAPSWAPRWVADVGIGWMYSNVNGQDSTGRDIRIRTRSATAEISPRYRLGEFWQVGPAVEILFGADTGFGPSVGNSFGSAYAGLRVVYETRSAQLPLRFLIQGLTDLNVPNRQVNLVTAGFQIGIPIRVSLGTSSGASQKIVQTDVLSESRSAPIRLVLDHGAKSTYSGKLYAASGSRAVLDSSLQSADEIQSELENSL